MIIVSFIALSAILFALRPSFTWIGADRELYQKLKKKTWTMSSYKSIVDSERTLEITCKTSERRGFKSFTYCLTNLKTGKLICVYKGSTNFIVIIEDCGISNPLSKIIDPFITQSIKDLYDYQYKKFKQKVDNL